MNADLVVLLTFAAVTLTVVGLVKFVTDTFFRHHEAVNERLREEFRDELRQRAQQSSLFKDLQQLAADAALPQPTLWRRLVRRVEQSGLPITLSQLLACAGICALVGLSATLAYGGNVLQALAIAAIAFAVPLWVVDRKRTVRIRRLCQQLPDAFDMMARALRAGQTVTAAFQMVANDYRGPVAEEFGYCYEQQHLGITQEVALRDLATRTGVMELQIVVVAMIVQRRTGGNLAELLGKLATLVRKRLQIQAKIRALTGEGRMQANMLIALPPLCLAAMYFVNPQYTRVLFDHSQLLYTAGALQGLGLACIRSVARLEG